MAPTMLPPSLERDPELPSLVEFDPDSPLWNQVCETAIDTVRPTGEPE